MTGKVRPRTLFLIAGVWFGLALLWVWFSHRWLTGFEHQAWGIVTIAVFLAYIVSVIGWLIPMIWALIGLFSPLPTQGKHIR